MKSYLFLGGPFHGKYIETDGQKKNIKIAYLPKEDRKAGRNYPSTFTYYRRDLSVVTGVRREPWLQRPAFIRYVYSITKDDTATKDLLYSIFVKEFIIRKPDQEWE